MIPIKFKCSKCGSDRLQDITKGAIQSTEILGVDEDDLLIYGDSLTEGGKTCRFQCGECGNVIKDANGKTIKSLTRMAEWLKEQAGKQERH